MAKQAPDTDKGRNTVWDQTQYQHVSTHLRTYPTVGYKLYPGAQEPPKVAP